MQDQLTVAAQPPAPSGLDSYRLLFVPPAGEEPGMPAETDSKLHEAPCGSGLLRYLRSGVDKYEAMGYRFVRAERKPDANGSGKWPWEEIPVGDGGKS